MNTADNHSGRSVKAWLDGLRLCHIWCEAGLLRSDVLEVGLGSEDWKQLRLQPAHQCKADMLAALCSAAHALR